MNIAEVLNNYLIASEITKKMKCENFCNAKIIAIFCHLKSSHNIKKITK